MEIMVEFIMFSDEDFPVDEISTQIGIGGCRIQKKGDVILYGQHKQLSRIETCTSLMYSTGYIETIEVMDVAKIMYDMLLPCENQIMLNIKKYMLSSRFCVVINLTDNPCIILSSEFINLASRFNAEIMFDTYINYDDDGKILHR